MMITQFLSLFLSELQKTDPWYQHQLKLFCMLPGALLLWRLWAFTISPTLRPHEPKELPYWIPFLGHTISFFADADKTFSRGRGYFDNAREPFSITVAGTRLYVITSAADVTAVYRNTEQLAFEGYVLDMMLTFKASHSAMEKMRQPFPQSSKPLYRGRTLVNILERLIRQQLEGPQLEKLQKTMLENVDNAMTWQTIPPKAILPSSSTDRKVSLMQWTREILIAGATSAFFGDTLLEIQPRLVQSFYTFDNKSWKLTWKIPPPWSDDMNAERIVCQNALETYFEMPEEKRTGQCWLVETLEGEMKLAGMESKDIAAYLMMIYWVINANAWKLSFWMLAYLMYNPDLLHTIRSEIDPAITICRSPSDLEACLSQSPNLVSFYLETIRLVTSAVSVRNVTTPVIIGTKHLMPGGRVVIPSRQLLLHDDVFGSDAEDFDPKRFLVNKDLKNSPSYRPFGGGASYCSGRFLAKAEVLTCVALAIGRFDMELVAEKSGRNGGFPRLETNKLSLGIMGPVEGDDVIVNIGQRTW